MTPQILIDRVETSIFLSKSPQLESRVNGETAKVKGFSTPTMRNLINRLCIFGGTTYLEVGVWHGASFFAACCQNPDLRAIAVDNFSQAFGTEDVRTSFLTSFDKVKTPESMWEFIEGDAFSVNNQIPEGVDVFFFDGFHDFDSQRKAMSHFTEKLSDVAIILVDDFLWSDVSRGTMAGIEDSKGKYRVVKEWVLSGAPHDCPIWHNGLFLAVIEKV